MSAVAVAEAVALAGAVRLIVKLNRDNRELRVQLAEFAHLALIDGLTGLRNRRAFDEELGRALGARSRRVVPGRLAIVMIDVRGLKSVNDSLGHHAGDERLITLASVLTAEVRESDSVYRIGGDEFMLILPGQGAEEALRLVQRLKAALDAEDIHISAGIAEASGSANAGVLMRRADRSLVAAKRGPKSVIVWSPEVGRLSRGSVDGEPPGPPATEPR